MPVEFGSESNYAKEMRRWETHHTKFGPPGRQYTFQEYPKRMYKFKRSDETGKGIVVDEAFDANDIHEERNFLSRGFYASSQEAYDAVLKEQTEHGILAAEREYAIKHGRLSESAVKEVRAAEAEAGARHLPDVPEKPRRGRPRKDDSAA